jgi:branched-chain amino acid transport system substrate-binding protein
LDEGVNEKMDKKLLAIIVIIIVAAGAVVGVMMLLPPVEDSSVKVGQLVTPGAPAGTSSDQIIVVGILDPMTEIQGEGAWKGSYLACREINQAGGLTVDGDTYYFGIIAEDTYESEPSLDISKGTAAATKIISEDGAQYIIGGFRTESVLAYVDIVMDNEMLFFGTGASTDTFCQNVLDDYDTYKYWFRSMPINSTSLASELLRFLIYLKGYMTAALSKNVTKVAIVREDLDWTVPMSAFLNGYLPLYNFTIVKEIAYPITAEAADFATYWQQIQDSGAQITIPVISAQGGILMTTQYQSVQPKCLIAGIDVMSQLDTYWDETGGACQHEILLQSLVRTNKTTKSLAFWDAFVGEYNEEPLYTAVGSYDAMYQLKYGIEEAQSFDSDDIVDVLEDLTPDNTLEGAGGNVAFTSSHDLYEGYDPVEGIIYSVTLFVQWQADGAKECVTSGGLVYPEFVVTAPISFPSWGINDP